VQHLGKVFRREGNVHHRSDDLYDLAYVPILHNCDPYFDNAPDPPKTSRSSVVIDCWRALL